MPSIRDRAGIHFVPSTLDRDSVSRLLRNSVLVVLAVLVLYALPTALELAAMRHWNPWVSMLLPGDAAGCVCLAIVFRRVKAGILLYCLLTVLEACAYGVHMLPLDALLWFTDLVPTVVVAAMVLRPAGSGGGLVAAG